MKKLILFVGLLISAGVVTAAGKELKPAGSCVQEDGKQSYQAGVIQPGRFGTCELLDPSGEAFAVHISSAGQIRAVKLTKFNGNLVSTESVFWFGDEPQIIRHRVNLEPTKKLQFTEMPGWAMSLISENLGIFSSLAMPLPASVTQDDPKVRGRAFKVR